MSNGPALLFYALLLILPITALVARRVPLATLVKLAVVWAVIFGLGLMAITAIT